MPSRLFALRIVLALALIANALPSSAGMAMALGLAPCGHESATAASARHATEPTGAHHHCHDQVVPGKKPVPPCCAGGKCACGSVDGPGVLAALSARAPHVVPAPPLDAALVASAPPVPTRLLRPPIA